MKAKKNIWALSYASFSSDDNELFTDTLGLYDTKEDAVNAMNDNIKQDIEEGDDEDKWEVNDDSADYQYDFSYDCKSYKIKSF